MKRIAEVLKRHWGYGDFLPLQREAMACVLEGRDSVVVLPTGGGKSLCFQAPALAMEGLAVVVSPLIALMKDQMDALHNCGVSAACLNSSIISAEKSEAVRLINRGELRVLYVAPERLVMPGFLDMLRANPPAYFAIDEAHCISAWGHDFRLDYRELRILREVFPKTSIHAFTATATPRVRADIASQLQLSDPSVLVGSFDRSNLVFSVEECTPKAQVPRILQLLENHSDEAGIIYCPSRKKTEQVCADLKQHGHAALHYHAGMEAEDRRRTQEAFARDETRIIVATVAFGMGIDKPDVRFVVHAGMPKGLDQYQQESGRAGRDGLEAECLLLHSKGDYFQQKGFIHQIESEEFRKIAQGKLSAIYQYCTEDDCRHRTLVQYFGQAFTKPNCGACDFCLEDLCPADDALVLAQKILSCVARLKEACDAACTVRVLTGSDDADIILAGHNSLSTWGLLRDEETDSIYLWIEQLIAQGFLRCEGEAGILKLTQTGWSVLRGELTPALLRKGEAKQQPIESPVAVFDFIPPRSKPERVRKKISTEHIRGKVGPSPLAKDNALFQELFQARKRLADKLGKPEYFVVSDVTLRELANRRPASRKELLDIIGIGEYKADQYGPEFLAVIAAHRSHKSSA